MLCGPGAPGCRAGLGRVQELLLRTGSMQQLGNVLKKYRWMNLAKEEAEQGSSGHGALQIRAAAAAEKAEQGRMVDGK